MPVVKTQKGQFWRKQDIVETLKPFLHLLVLFFSSAIRDHFLSSSLLPVILKDAINHFRVLYGPHTLCCNKDQETPRTQLQFWNADAPVELSPLGYRKKASTGLFCTGANWIWWQQQSRFCKMGKEEAGMFGVRAGGSSGDWKGTAAFQKVRRWWRELMIPLPFTTAPATGSGSACYSAALTAQSSPSTAANDANISQHHVSVG